MTVRKISEVAAEAVQLEDPAAQAELWERYALALAAALAVSLCGAYYWKSDAPWLRCHRPANHDPALLHQTNDRNSVYTWAVGS